MDKYLTVCLTTAVENSGCRLRLNSLDNLEISCQSKVWSHLFKNQYKVWNFRNWRHFLCPHDQERMEVYLHKTLQNNSELMQFIKIITGNHVGFLKELFCLFHYSSSFQISKLFLKCPLYINCFLWSLPEAWKGKAGSIPSSILVHLKRYKLKCIQQYV